MLQQLQNLFLPEYHSGEEGQFFNIKAEKNILDLRHH